MNAIMKRLTIVSTLFIPLTFLVGVWGMIGLALRLFHSLGRHDSYRSIDLAIYETKGLVLKPILTI